MPLRIPLIELILLAARQVPRGRRTGIPPPTLASNRKLTLFSFAIRTSSGPNSATSALLDVQTFLPFNRASLTNCRLDNCPGIYYNYQANGVWRSLVSRLVRVQEASGSNPDTPTKGKSF